MNKVEVQLREKQHRRTLLKGINDFYNIQQRHLLTAYLFFWRNSPGKGQALPGWFSDFQKNAKFDLQPTPDGTTENAPDWNKVRKKVRKFTPTNPMNPLVLDLFTFLVPGRWGLFLTIKGCEGLIGNLDSWDPTVSTAVMRSFFLTPEFVAFSSAVFRPLISKYALANAVINPEDIKTRWNANMDRFPAAIRFLFKPKTEKQPEAPKKPQNRRRARESKENPELFNRVRVLSAAFFEIALTPGYERLYGFVEPWVTVPDRVRTALQDLLTANGKNSILSELANAIPSEIQSEMILNDNDNTDLLPSLFKPFLSTELDQSLLGQLKKNQLPDVRSYSVRLLCHEPFKDKDQVGALEQTMSAMSKAACLRHLLQRADPIPRFNSVPKGMKVDTFFRDYVVARGPVGTAYERAVNYELLIDKIPVLTMDQILSTLKYATFERKKEIRVLSLFARISRVYTRILNEGAIGRAIVEKALLWTIIEPFCEPTRRHPKQEYFARPGLLVEDHNQLTQFIRESVPPEAWNASVISELVFGFLSGELLFRSFRHSRSDLSSLDKHVHDSVKNNFAELMKKQFLGCVDTATNPEQKEQAEWLLKTVMRLEKKPGNAIGGRITAAFAETHPLRMLIELTEGLKLGRDDFLRAAPSNLKLGSSHYHLMNVSMIFLAKPAYLVSTFVFLHDFCCKMDAFIGTEYRQLIMVLEYILKELIVTGSRLAVDLLAMCRLAE